MVSAEGSRPSLVCSAFPCCLQEQNFDVLYVVDPHRSWYHGELAPLQAGHACGLPIWS